MSQNSLPPTSERATRSTRPQVTARGREATSDNVGAAAAPSSVNNSPNGLARLLGAFIVVAVGRVSDLVPGLSKIPIAKVIVVLAIIAAVRLREIQPSVTWKSVPPAKLTVLLMSITAVSLLFSVLRSATFAIITSTSLAVVIILLMTIKAARGWAPVKTILHSAVFASVILVANVFTSKVNDSGGPRAGYSSSYDPNDFAYVLIGLLPLVITFGIVTKGAKRLLYFGTACLMTVAILLTQSRGGFIGLTFDVIAMTFALPVAWRGQLHFQTSKSRVLARVVLLTLIGVVGWHLLPEYTRSRLGSITELGSDYNVNTTDIRAPTAGRLAIWTRNLPLTLNRPWGYGAGSFGTVDGRFAGGQFRAPHNTFLQALIELGVPGFALFIAVIFSSLRYLRAPPNTGQNPTPSPDEPRAFARALGVGLVGLCITGFFLSQLYANVFWTLITWSCAVGIVRRMPPGSRGIPSRDCGT